MKGRDMFGNSNYINESIRTEARQELACIDDVGLGELWGRLNVVFQKWKLEHGDRNPIPNRGMLSDLLPIPFDKAEPWECADFIFSSPVALANKLYMSYPPFVAITDKDGVRKVMALAIIKSEHAFDIDMFEAGKILRTHTNVEIGMRAGIDVAREQTKKNLKKGPAAASKQRTKEKDKRESVLLKAIGDMFDKPEKPGWNMTNEQIRGFLLKNGNPYGYTESVILAKVKREAAKYRKAGNVTLAQCATE